jgi:hypothetical protein
MKLSYCRRQVIFLKGRWAEIGKHGSTISREPELVAPVVVAFFGGDP